MKNRGRIALLIALVATVAPTAPAADRWLHIRVVETGLRPTTVRVNLPFSLVQRAAPLLEDTQIDGGEIDWNGDHVTVAELRESWKTLRSGSGPLERDGASWELVRNGAVETLVVRAHDDDEERMEMRIPAGLVDALLRDDQQLDLVAAVDAIARYGSGELVAVDDDGTRVRIWVDEIPEAQ